MGKMMKKNDSSTNAELMDIIFFCGNCGLCVNEITTYHVPGVPFKWQFCPQCGMAAEKCNKMA